MSGWHCDDARGDHAALHSFHASRQIEDIAARQLKIDVRTLTRCDGDRLRLAIGDRAWKERQHVPEHSAVWTLLRRRRLADGRQGRRPGRSATCGSATTKWSPACRLVSRYFPSPSVVAKSPVEASWGTPFRITRRSDRTSSPAMGLPEASVIRPEMDPGAVGRGGIVCVEPGATWEVAGLDRPAMVSTVMPVSRPPTGLKSPPTGATTMSSPTWPAPIFTGIDGCRRRANRAGSGNVFDAASPMTATR